MMLLPLSTFLLLALGGEVHSLKCYRGQHNSTAPLDSSVARPVECPAGAMACVKTIDHLRTLTFMACQMDNCTMSGVAMSTVCRNNTSAMIVSCCCCEDGCNLNPEIPAAKYLSSQSTIAGKLNYDNTSNAWRSLDANLLAKKLTLQESNAQAVPYSSELPRQTTKIISDSPYANDEPSSNDSPSLADKGKVIAGIRRLKPNNVMAITQPSKEGTGHTYKILSEDGVDGKHSPSKPDAASFVLSSSLDGETWTGEETVNLSAKPAKILKVAVLKERLNVQLKDNHHSTLNETELGGYTTDEGEYAPAARSPATASLVLSFTPKENTTHEVDDASKPANVLLSPLPVSEQLSTEENKHLVDDEKRLNLNESREYESQLHPDNISLVLSSSTPDAGNETSAEKTNSHLIPKPANVLLTVVPRSGPPRHTAMEKGDPEAELSKTLSLDADPYKNAKSSALHSSFLAAPLPVNSGVGNETRECGE